MHFKNFLKIFSNRLLILFIFFFVLYYLLIVKLFDLQIVNGEKYQNDFKQKTKRTVPISAFRGEIFDRNGNPLAITKSSSSIKIDPSISVSNLNTVIYDLITLLDKNGENYIDDFPITKEEPFEFTFSTKDQEKWFKKELKFSSEDENLPAKESLKYLRQFFKVDEHYTDVEARNIISIRTLLYLQRYSSFNPVTIATNVSDKTAVAIEEDSKKYKSIYVYVEPYRIYPYGKYTSHILGFTGNINADELKSYEEEGIKYSKNDIVGKSGLEKSFETKLKGEKGSMVIESNYYGRKISTLDIEEPINGNDVYITLDANLQKETYEIIEKTLSNIIINKLRDYRKNEKIEVKEALISLIDANNVPIKDIFSKQAPISLKVKDLITNELFNKVEEKSIQYGYGKNDISNALETFKENQNLFTKNLSQNENYKNIHSILVEINNYPNNSKNIFEIRNLLLLVEKQILIEQIEKGKISEKEILLLLLELDVITKNEDFIKKLNRNQTREALIQKRIHK